MIFLMTKDSFLLQGFWQLKDNHEMINSWQVISLADSLAASADCAFTSDKAATAPIKINALRRDEIFIL